MGLPVRIDELPLRSLGRACERLQRLAADAASDGADLYHASIAAIHGICEALVESEAAGVNAGELRELLGGVRAIHASSPFMRRLQEWPRGYPGDFETIEWLWRAENRAAGPLPRALEHYALTSSIAQQHRNKVAHQAACILDAQAQHEPCRVLVLACGSSPDLRGIQRHVRQTSTFVLCDSDCDALAFSKSALSPIEGQCIFVHGWVPRVLPALRRFGPFHLVLAGGLFDYLPDRVIRRTLARIGADLLAPGGEIVFTNIASGNPFRVWLEYIADWPLRERSESDIEAIAISAGFEAPALSRDATGLAILARLVTARIEGDRHAPSICTAMPRLPDRSPHQREHNRPGSGSVVA